MTNHNADICGWSFLFLNRFGWCYICFSSNTIYSCNCVNCWRILLFLRCGRALWNRVVLRSMNRAEMCAVYFEKLICARKCRKYCVCQSCREVDRYYRCFDRFLQAIYKEWAIWAWRCVRPFSWAPKNDTSVMSDAKSQPSQVMPMVSFWTTRLCLVASTAISRRTWCDWCRAAFYFPTGTHAHFVKCNSLILPWRFLRLRTNRTHLRSEDVLWLVPRRTPTDSYSPIRRVVRLLTLFLKLSHRPRTSPVKYSPLVCRWNVSWPQ